MGEDWNENESRKKTWLFVKKLLFTFSFLLFIFTIWKFLNTPGSEISVLSLLFNMILYLGIIIFIIHRKKFIFDYSEFLQFSIDK